MAKLFVVPPNYTEPEEPGDEDLFEFSGEIKKDLATALRAIAFLLDFVDSVGGADGLRCCANDICKCEGPR